MNRPATRFPGKATRVVVDDQGRRRTVPAWAAPRAPHTGGLAEWLAARRPIGGTKG